MKVFAVIFALVATLSISAQYTGDHAVIVSSSGSNASTNLAGLTDSNQSDRASIFPMRAYAPTGFGYVPVVGYVLDYPDSLYGPPPTATFVSAIAEPAALSSYSRPCTAYYGAWTLQAWPTAASAKAFYDGLAAGQRVSALLYSSPGVEPMTDRWVVVYRQIDHYSCALP